MASLGIVANVYNEVNALPGWLEMANSGLFDDIQIMHAGPQGAESNDGTIELLEKWRIPIHRTAIDQGFGIVRTAAVRASKCDFVMLLDADERFFRAVNELHCQGEPQPRHEVDAVLNEYDRGIRFQDVPCNWENLSKLGENLTVSVGGVYDQGAWLRSILEEHTTIDAVCTIRRHWHDFSMRKPTQNWERIPDWQVRIVKNTPSIHWDANTRMHENLIGAKNPFRPNLVHGPFFDHFHFGFKRMERDQRAHDVRIYDAIHKREAPPTS